MHCYCCDIDVGDTGYDKPTDRYYCSGCFEPTTEVMLSRELKEASGEGSISVELAEILDTSVNQEELLSFEEAFPEEDEEEE